MRKLLLAVAVALVLPGVARAGLVTMVARDVPLGPRGLASAAAPQRFNLLGIHWRGSGTVEFRTRSLAGRWSGWQAADDDSGPDLRSPEHRVAWRDGGLAWVGASTAVRFRTAGDVSRVRAYYLWSKVTGRPARSLSIAGSPAIVTRSQWQADEKILRATPRYAPALKVAIVHHTAGSNAYSPAQAAAIVRGIEIYHVKANGWNDIGYNFLVDRYGTVYEGRGGGMTRNVIGAHSLGFNTGTVGVSLIGNFQAATPPPVMISSLVRLLAWRLDVAHVDPLSRAVLTSAGNPRYRAGRVVTLQAISAHRDTYPTACPGTVAYGMLPSIRGRVAATGLPKLYSPVVSGILGGTVRFQARLSSARGWTVTVADALGAVVARGHGFGSGIDWSWRSAGAGKGPFSWTIAAGASVLPATGRLGVSPPPVTPGVPIAPPAKPVVPAPVPVPIPPVSSSTLLTRLSAAPAVVSPGADPASAYVTVEFTLAADATVTARLTGGLAPVTLFSASVPAGDSSFSWSLAAVPDGRYTLEVSAKAASGAIGTQTLQLVVYRSLSGYSVAPALISPNGDGVNESAVIGFTLGRPVSVQIVLQRAGAPVGTIYTGQLGPGSQSIIWNGTVNGVRVPDGAYDLVTTASDALGSVTLSSPVTIDATAPTLTLLDAATLRFQLGEPGTVSVTVNGQPFVQAEPAGVFTIPWTGAPVSTLTAQASDAAGNLGSPLTWP